MGISKLTGARARIMGGLLTSMKRIRIASTPDGSAEDTTFTLPAKAVVFGVWIDVKVAEATGATKTLDVGPTGNPDGYLDGVDVSSTGIKKGTLVSGGQTLGALLSVDEDGSGALVPEPDITSGGVLIQYEGGSNDFAEFRGDVYILYANLVA